MHKILVIRLHFLLDALHVSDYISPSSGANFIICTLHLEYNEAGHQLFIGFKKAYDSVRREI